MTKRRTAKAPGKQPVSEKESTLGEAAGEKKIAVAVSREQTEGKRNTNSREEIETFMHRPGVARGGHR